MIVIITYHVKELSWVTGFKVCLPITGDLYSRRTAEVLTIVDKYSHSIVCSYWLTSMILTEMQVSFTD